MGYVLRTGISFCRIGQQTVFLDVSADRYFGLNESTQASFLKLIDQLELNERDETELDSLVASNVLSAVPGDGAPAPFPIPAVARSSLLDQQRSKAPKGKILRAFLEFMVAKIHLRVRPFYATLLQLKAAKAGINQITPSTDQLYSITSAFEMTGLIFTLQDQCLAQSIGVTRHLLRHGIAADLVLGVKLRPFCAHCWVQVDGMLVNDRLDRVRNFTPLLVI